MNTLRLASYNVHGWIGRDGVRSPKRIGQVLGEIGAQVIALQEVLYPSIEEEHTSELEQLAQGLGMHLSLGPTLLREDELYGNALLTAWPVHSLERIDLSFPGREPRGALMADLLIDGRRVRVAGMHLGLRRRERRAQLPLILAATEGTPTPNVTVLMGDFNEWLPRSEVYSRLTCWAGGLYRARTFSSRHPLFTLDLIVVRPYQACRSIRAHRSRLSAVASDHLPVHGQVSLQPAT